MAHRAPVLAVTLAIAALGSAAGCGGTAAPSPSAGRAVQNDGAFRLAFELPATAWKSTDVITGGATLALTGAGPSVVSGSGLGPIGFDVREIGGRGRHMDYVQTADCVPYPITLTAPITSVLKKTGGSDASDPEAAFYQAFFADPHFRLPAGTWDLTAVASFSEGPGCGSQSHRIEATIRLAISP